MSVRWVIENRSNRPPTCFPVDYDRAGLIEVTAIGDQWARFMDEKSGRSVDCADFAAARDRDLAERVDAIDRAPQ